MAENIRVEQSPHVSEEEKQRTRYTEEGYIDPYQKFRKKDLVLRDELAIARTRLAEERTQLSYIRTGVSLLLGGIFCDKLNFTNA